MTGNYKSGIKVDKNVSIDLLYGPYKSINEANSKVTPYLRSVSNITGLSVGRTICIDNGIIREEYWWNGGITDEHLTLKIPPIVIPTVYTQAEVDALLLLPSTKTVTIIITTNNVITPIKTITIPLNESQLITFAVKARSVIGDTLGGRYFFVVKNISGVATIVDTLSEDRKSNFAGTVKPSITVVGADVIISVRGQIATTITWGIAIMEIQ